MKVAFARRHLQQRGIALVIVLASLVLLTILILAFLSNIGTELQSSKVYANGSSVKLLAQSAVSLVIGQIQTATADQTKCWASQPGMIRTYDTTGKAAGWYKLYSDATMQGSGVFDHTNPSNLVPSTWYNQKGVYIDLNQPVGVDGSNYFPILDGNSADYSQSYTSPLKTLGTSAATATLNSLKYSTSSNVGANGLPGVTGFWLTSNTPTDPSSPSVAPMPVMWLYVLQNGTVLVPDASSSNGVVTFANAGSNGPTTSNPIVGRMAYWTDDETCKVNINTASEGTYWDTPRTWTAQDYNLAQYQPAQNEFQRYPGHPSTVSLSSVFNGLTGDSGYPENFYPITPRVIAGGSKEGTAAPTGALTLRSTRLYASPDEFLFQPNLVSGVPGVGLRGLNNTQLKATTELDQTAIDKARFFITSESKAPDVNLFNLPRVSMWPITLKNGVQKTTPFDQLIAFCSTINNHIFYFQRQDPTSPTTDLPTTSASTGLGRNRELLEYLRTLTSQAIPGFGPSNTSFATKYGTPGNRDQILTEMFDYIRCTNLLDSSQGSSWVGQYAPSLDNNAAVTNNTYQGGTGLVVPIIDQNISGLPGAASASDHPRGFGRFPTLHQAGFVFIGAGDATSRSTATTVGSVHYAPVTGNNHRMQAAFLMQLFDPSQGLCLVHPWYQIQVTGLNSLKWGPNATTLYSMGFPAGTITLSQPYARGDGLGSANSGANLPPPFNGGIIDFRTLAMGLGTNGYPSYPCVSAKTGGVVQTAPYTTPDPASFPDPAYPGVFYFSGGTVTVTINALSASRVPTTVQTITLNFPASTAGFPVPKTLDNPVSTTGAPIGQDFLSFTDSTTSRLNSGFYLGYNYITSCDVVRVLEPTLGLSQNGGDMRLIAARTTVPSSFYGPLTSPSSVAYQSNTNGFSHMFRMGWNEPVYGAAGGILLQTSGGSYSGAEPQYSPPYENGNDYAVQTGGTLSRSYASMDNDVPNQGSSITMPGGVAADWDNGMANSRDGAFINKADEGDMGTVGGTQGIAYFDLDYAPNPTPPSATLFSPNRMIPSPGMFGSLPTGVWGATLTPWQTLLFRPGPANHPGLLNPPDHLMLDLFNMPVVEPYAISEPLATSGRINMNYLIVPFTYINRDTGVRAALKSQMELAISNSLINTYKTNGHTFTTSTLSSSTVRYPLNLDSTLSQFLARFYNLQGKQGASVNNTPDIFHSASEICDVDLVPTDAAAPGIPITRTNMDAYWNNHLLTGDNSRERPYTNLYPLLTTKSNTYTVHFRVQSLKQLGGVSAKPSEWREGTDLIVGEYRGSQTIERYIDPNDSVPDYADPSTGIAATFPPSTPLSSLYKFRVVSTRQFSP